MKNIRELLQYYYISRGSGHTTLLQKGIGNFDGRFILVGSNRNVTKDIAQGNKNAILMNLDDVGDGYRLRGMRLPIALDNSAIMSLLEGSLDEIAKIDTMLIRQRLINISLEEQNKSLRDKFLDDKSLLWEYSMVKDTWIYKIALKIRNIFTR